MLGYLNFHMQMNEIGPMSKHYSKKKKKLEMGKDLHKRPKTMKLLEEFVVTKLLNRRLSDRCLF